MAMVNNFANAKDSRWLQLEVCREYQRNKCTRSDTECKFAHPPATVEVQNGRVIACYDSIKGRCNREKPPCKYFHPPPHLKDQLLINGRNHLALKNALMQQVPLQPVLAGQIPAVATTNPYLTSLPAAMGTATSFPYLTHSPMMAAAAAAAGLMPADAMAAQLSVVPTATLVTPQKIPRTDRLEPHGVESMIGKKRLRDPADDLILAFPGMSPYTKRPALDKSGVPVYQPGTAAAYQQALAMQVQQPFVPVSFAGHPASLQRF